METGQDHHTDGGASVNFNSLTPKDRSNDTSSSNNQSSRVEDLANATLVSPEVVGVQKHSLDSASGAIATTLDSILSSPLGGYAFSLQPLSIAIQEILRGIKILESTEIVSGLLVTKQDSEGRGEGAETPRMETLVSALRMKVAGMSPTRLDDMLEELVQSVPDSSVQDRMTIVQMYERNNKERDENDQSMGIGMDEIGWIVGPDSVILRRYIHLRRLSLSLCIAPTDKNCSNGASFMPIGCSLLDILLQLGEEAASKMTLAIVRQICSIEEELIRIRSDDLRNDMKKLSALLAKSLQENSDMFKGRQLTSSLIATLCTGLFIDTPLRIPFESFSVPEQSRQRVEMVRSERKRLLSSFLSRKAGISKDNSCHCQEGAVRLPNRELDGNVLLTGREISEDAFHDEYDIMEGVNKTFPRSFKPGTSCPKMKKISLDETALHDLRSIFFDSDGSLKNSIKKDIDVSTRHGFINFSNPSCQDQRQDERWQIPVKRHSERGFVDVRSIFESFLSQNGLLDPREEHIHDLGILVGGTEDQSLHHDLPRQTTCWLKEPPSKRRKKQSGDGQHALGGWEFDRIAYNDTMFSPYAPGGILLGTGENGRVQLGVQKNEIERYQCQEGFCRIVDGKEGDVFEIKRENKFLVVLECSGVMFTGDFVHAGVRNVEVGSKEDALMVDLNNRLQSSIFHGAQLREKHEDIRKDIISIFCEFKGLSRICRIHCSKEPNSDWLTVPRNAVGFVECAPNPPSHDDYDEDKERPTTT